MTEITIDIIPDWGSKIECRYEFADSIAITGGLNEQRRPISEESWLKTSVTYHVMGLEAQKFYNLLLFGKDKIVNLPVYMEILIPILIGANSIQFLENLNYYYNLKNKNVTKILIVDYRNKTYEVKTISLVDFSTNTISFTENIVGEFTVNGLLCYPVIESVIVSVSKVDETNTFDAWKIDFKEYKKNG